MKELVEKLQQLDIPRRECEVYVALLQKKEFTAPEISKITTVSRTKSYEILQNLVKKGLCNENYRNGIKVFSCVDPKKVIENIKSEFEKKKDIANELSLSLTYLFKKNETIESPLDYIEVLTNTDQVREKWLVIQKNTKKELLYFTKPPYVSDLDDNVENESDIIEKQVKVKSIYEYMDASPEELYNLIKTIEKYQKVGEEARILEELPMKLLVSDENISMFTLCDRISMKPSMTSLLVNHPSFTKAMREVFNSYWQKGYTLEEFKKNKYKILNSD
jgi:HTH-type transcriptional regulator, sugar sensing transcriptional regulator